MEAERVVDILRRLRHDFGNYLQVVLGYIDLNRPEQAREYVLGLVENLAAERVIFENLEEEASLYLYQQLLLARDLGIILRYKDLDPITWQIMQRENEPFRTIEQISPKFRAMEDEPIVNLSIYNTDNGVRMRYEWDKPEPGQLEEIIEELK
jgi:stage 0 sporulation protein B (sporulation initiation phosphotransferase)